MIKRPTYRRIRSPKYSWGYYQEKYEVNDAYVKWGRAYKQIDKRARTRRKSYEPLTLTQKEQEILQKLWKEYDKRAKKAATSHRRAVQRGLAKAV